MVVDASVAVKWFFPEPAADLAPQLLPAADALIAPDLLLIEVGSALTRRYRRREMSRADVSASMQDMQMLGIRYIPAATLLSDALAVSLANRQAMVDRLCLALTRQPRQPLATFDPRPAGLATGRGIPLWKP